MTSLRQSRVSAALQERYVMAQKHAIFLGLVLVGLMGCDSWYRPPQVRTRGDERPLPDTDVHEVITEKISLAEQELEEVACVEISDESASALAGQSVERELGKDLYLVRGVYLNRGTGRFTVTLVGSDLLVHNGSLGHSAVDMKRQALIVSLPHKPNQVFVSCNQAE
jgi:hypothetical protein